MVEKDLWKAVCLCNCNYASIPPRQLVVDKRSLFMVTVTFFECISQPYVYVNCLATYDGNCPWKLLVLMISYSLALR